jgi:L-seryl-tRNA(Ser) seleniumtransferase
MENIVRLVDIPSVDRLLQSDAAAGLIAQYGRALVTGAMRDTLHAVRSAVRGQDISSNFTTAAIFNRISIRLERDSMLSLRRVFNLTGTILHTNLGRATLPEAAIDAVLAVARGPSNLEFDLSNGKRGDRDDHVEQRICQLIGAEAATVANNNAAAVMLVLNSLGAGREILTSRGELVEIGGSFRMPDIIASAGCKLREVGTTNRTHLADFGRAIGPNTGLVMKVHTSNYEIVGFTATVGVADLARLCKEHDMPFVIDLGSGSLVDLRRYGLPHEPTPGEALAQGADIVTFSGDKLLGGPQAGIIAGRADLIAKIKRNPMKRALRVDKITIAALSAVLRLYADPERVIESLPGLRAITRPSVEIRALAQRLCPAIAAALAGVASVGLTDCESQVGSGASPAGRIPSVGIAIRPLSPKSRGAAQFRIEALFRSLPTPVVGRMHDGAFILDLRCLEDVTGFVAQLIHLNGSPGNVP